MVLKMVHAFVLSRVPDKTDAQDITQETLLRVHRGLGTLKDSQKFDAWIFQIARNAIADHYRAATKRKIENAADISDRPVDSEEAGLRQEVAAYVRSVVEGLPSIQREALLLTEYQGLSQVEMAHRLGISVSSAKSRVQRARALMKQILERCCHWETDKYGEVLEVTPRAQCGCDC